MCFVKTWQKSELPHFFHYIFELSCYVHFLYIFKKKKKKIFHNHRNHQKEEHLGSPFRHIYSIYIHSWAHKWHPFRKVFLLACMEGMADTDTLPPYKIVKVSANIWNLPQHWMLSADLWLYGTVTVSGRCAVGILCPSRDSFGLMQLRCRKTHTSIQVNVKWQKNLQYKTKADLTGIYNVQFLKKNLLLLSML